MSQLIDYLQDRLEARIAVLLTLRDVLTNIQQSTNPERAATATDYLNMQLGLEGMVPGIRQRVANVQAGTESADDVKEIGSFVAQMEKHIRLVNMLLEGVSPTVAVAKAGGAIVATYFGIRRFLRTFVH